MKRRQWTGKQKLQIVLEGVEGGITSPGYLAPATKPAERNIGGSNWAMRRSRTPPVSKSPMS